MSDQNKDLVLKMWRALSEHDWDHIERQEQLTHHTAADFGGKA